MQYFKTSVSTNIGKWAFDAQPDRLIQGRPCLLVHSVAHKKIRLTKELVSGVRPEAKGFRHKQEI